MSVKNKYKLFFYSYKWSILGVDQQLKKMCTQNNVMRHLGAYYDIYGPNTVEKQYAPFVLFNHPIILIIHWVIAKPNRNG